MQFTVLGSGSSGNAALVEQNETCILLDCGFSLKELTRRMSLVSRTPDQISAIIITHEHRDHIGGLPVFLRKYPVPVYMTTGTGHFLSHPSVGRLDSQWIRMIRAYESLRIGEIEVQPYPVPHDAREPAQFIFSHHGRRLAFLTDCGQVTPYIRDIISTPDALVIECNHDDKMLQYGSYSPVLKRRIAGEHGHLSNRNSAEWLKTMEIDRLQFLVGAHLSTDNNRNDLVEAMLTEEVGASPECVHIATQDRVTPWFEL